MAAILEGRSESLSQLIAEFGGTYAETAALGVTDEEDAWSRYAFKMATGSGKTKVMSLAIVWSYFHALRESDSPMAKHFVIIAPNLTVFERLKEDFKPEGGGPDIFDRDPLIPVEWRGDWNLATVLQDEAGAVSTGGTLYLTNIRRLFDNTRRRESGQTFDWMGPAVSKATALDTAAALRDRITSHQRVMVMNDEAHHVWDPDSAWNEAIKFLHETIQKRTGGGLFAQLDFSATPKDNQANYFKHIICDTPLGEAVDAGIIKTPIIGRAGRLNEQATDNAGYRWEMHLKLGYERWLKSRDEWLKTGKKPLIFVMCEDTKAADEIAARLNGDPVFKELNGRTINLHTNLKGKLKKIGKGADARTQFVENEKESSDEDLKALRKLSRELDCGASPHFCIVSVLMLREGWDVRNVTTTTVSIFPDLEEKDAKALDIALPRLTSANQTLPVLGPISEAEMREAFAACKPLPIGDRGPDEVQYEGRHLITGEVVEHMKVSLALLESGIGAISFYIQELEYVCKVKNTHQVLAPLLQKFFEELLFGAQVSVFDARLVKRLPDSDVREHVRAVFVPLIRRKVIQTQVRAPEAPPVPLSTWKPFQVTVSERHPVHQSPRTIFNLIPCNRSLETAFVEQCNRAADVAAFAKNAGPQSLRIDYLAQGIRLAFYSPDFFVRANSGTHYLVETKGQVDKETTAKARAAVEWCKAASTKQKKWEYVYVPEGVFQRFQGAVFSELARITAINEFRNTKVAHQETPLTDPAQAKAALVAWVEGLNRLWQASRKPA